eukprot:SAG11_NODE_29813_length_307_cov_0.519231_1_plen_20_part_10
MSGFTGLIMIMIMQVVLNRL